MKTIEFFFQNPFFNEKLKLQAMFQTILALKKKIAKKEHFAVFEIERGIMDNASLFRLTFFSFRFSNNNYQLHISKSRLAIWNLVFIFFIYISYDNLFIYFFI